MSNVESNTDATTPSRPVDRILVGVDESEASIGALRWAAGQARVTGSSLLVVHAYRFVPYPYVEPQLVKETAERDAELVVADAVRRAVADLDGLDVRTDVVPGHPARVLADLGRNSRMVVVGGGGHGELAGLLLGSVGLHLVSHAPVPVVVVPRTEAAARVPEPVPAAESAPGYVPFAFL